MGKLPVEPVWTQWRIGENTNICQIQFDEIEIASRRNRIQEGYNAKFGLLSSVWRLLQFGGSIPVRGALAFIFTLT